MSFLLRLCLGLVLLAPSLAHAQSFLETPSNGDKLSGIGVIRGWKCEAKGDITVRFDNDEALTYTMVYGSERPTTEKDEDGKIICGDTNNGFLFLINWGIFDDGEHTAVVSDDDGEFARSTFTVTTTGVPYLEDADACVTVNDFPSTGETTMLEWNQSTQHFEMVEACPPDEPAPPAEPVDLTCKAGLTVEPGAMCSGSLGGLDFTFSVDAAGQACVESALLDRCYDTDFTLLSASASKNDDGSWTINSL